LVLGLNLNFDNQFEKKNERYLFYYIYIIISFNKNNDLLHACCSNFSHNKQRVIVYKFYYLTMVIILHLIQLF